MAELLKRVEALEEWKRQREIQQITSPLDDPSRNILGVVKDEGRGASGLTQSINLTGNAETINVPAAYSDTEIILLDTGVRIEVPVISYP